MTSRQVMHLCQLPRLRERIGLIDQQHDARSVLASVASEKAIFDRRWRLREALEGASPGVASSAEFDSLYKSAFSMMTAPGVAKTFTIPEEDRARYGSSTLGDSCVLAHNLVRADAGTRFISISHNGWDLHADMFDPKNKRNHYGLSRELDSAFAALVADLATTRTKDGKTLLEKTFIVCMGEFGRTGGELTVNGGRDHNRSAFTAVFAGGGVRGGGHLASQTPLA